MSNTRKTAAIVQLAAQKRANARQRVQEALLKLSESGNSINFSSVGKVASVSKTFLYNAKNADLAEEIRRQRAALTTASVITSPSTVQPRSISSSKSDSAKDAQIVRLRERVKQLEQQVTSLQDENAILYGRLAGQ